MVTVGIAGLGPDWETRFRPALCALRDRIAVRAVYDPVGSRAEQMAGELNAAAVRGLVALSERADLRAFLLLDPGWHGWESLRLLCAQPKPVFIASGLGHDAATLRALYEQSVNSGQMLMPGLAARYTPATSRLRELMATRLGAPRTVEVDAVLPQTDAGPATESVGELCLRLLDWCGYIVDAPPSRVDARVLNGSADVEQSDWSVTLDWDRRRAGAASARAELRMHRHPSGTSQITPKISGTYLSGERIRIDCERGTASIHSARELTWASGDEPIRETLTAERSESEVMLDLFCRRVVGGLIPAADVADVIRGARLFEAARQSLSSGRPVDIPRGE